MAMLRFNLLLIFLLSFSCIFNHSRAQEFEMPGYINDISSCDFDLNGAEDILVVCPYADTLVILFNDGSGNFEINYHNIISLHAICGCVDEDSIPDLIAGTGQQYYYKSNGDRTFEIGIPILTFSGTISIYGLVDLNDDGWNDLLYTNTSGEYWGIFKNNGDLNFTNEIIQSGSSTTKPGVGFITYDSLPDIVLTYSAFNRSSVFVNNGDFNFSEVVLDNSFIGEAFIMNIDNQGTDDFAFANYYTNTIPLYEYIGENQFELHSNYYAPGTYTVGSFLVDDFDQDGYDDFIISRCNWYDCTDSIYIYFNDQNWSFYESQRVYVGYLGFFNLRSTDLNGDSFPDLYMSGAGTNGNKTLKILWNDGTGNFSYENPVGFKERTIAQFGNFRLKPNPVSDRLQVDFTVPESGLALLSFHSITGQQMLNLDLGTPSPGEHSQTLSLSSIPQGIYVLTLSVNGAVCDRIKVIKLK